MEFLIVIQNHGGMTIVVVTHEKEIANTATRQIRIRDGKVEA
jgi:ABC-type lipoprotein export system ATPase subunit